MSTRNISWGKGDRCVGLTNLPPSVPIVLKSGSLNLLEPSGSVKACNGIALPYLKEHSQVCITKTNQLVMFGAVIAARYGHQNKHIKELYGLNTAHATVLSADIARQ
jgi:hypothetical protein